MLKITLPFLLLGGLIASCGQASKDKSSGYNYIPPATQQPAAAPPQQNDFLSGNNNQQKPSSPFMKEQQPAANQALPAAKPGAVTTAPPVQIQPATAPVAKGMNPPHGQPGHRCDIAVGAPLNSKPAAAAAPPLTIQKTTAAAPAPVTVQKNPSVAATAPGMNPPHGQPGHRCDISVGAPLTSPPAKKDS